ncbi:MAG: hypothetical protein BWK80_28800 [Desulfobacteraceae bacterium IS3]|nr:MAG: hypothetical protein BWK80_28800 [Desulfobacteraceae bacterium IS3]
MIRRFTIFFLLLAGSIQTAWCDWGHHRSRSSDIPADPHLDAFIATVFIAIIANAVLLLFAGPIMVIFSRRIRDMLWSIPAMNLLLYLISIYLRSYPGGFAARFEPPGLAYTIGEIVLLLVLSLIVILILAAIRWFVNKVKGIFRKTA